MNSSLYSSPQPPDLELITTPGHRELPRESTQESARETAHPQTDLRLPGLAPQTRSTWTRLQRLLDLTLAALLLLLLLPLLALIALAIRLDTPGPVLFIQKRVGQGGREFPFFKFRSMVHDAEARRRALEQLNERTGPVFKMRQDPRITRVGRLLRRASLDELPQLLNVLRGEMSLVGPRPALPAEVALYSARERGRLSALPGVTGLWQVSGRADVGFEEAVEMDLRYVREQSVGLYLAILWRTIPAVLSGKGAY
jgi:lipopolysaccharide/colanic/teichoic acid biosynthesis glycosyltransferase